MWRYCSSHWKADLSRDALICNLVITGGWPIIERRCRDLDGRWQILGKAGDFPLRLSPV
jgi:hypothetical protein